MQRNFEDRLGQRMEEMNETQNSRSDKLGAILQHMQTDMQDLAGRLLDIAVSMQRLEVKLDRIAETGAKSRPLHQECNSTSPADLEVGIGHSEGSQQSNCGDSGRESKKKGTRAGAMQEVEPFQVCSQEVVRWKGSWKDKAPVENLERDRLENAQSFAIGGESDTNQHGAADALLELDTKFGIIDRKLERISASMKIKSEANEGDDEEDRRRLKEKLKVAIDLDRRSRVHTIVSKREVWLEYIFGICSPDQRMGKRGSR